MEKKDYIEKDDRIENEGTGSVVRGGNHGTVSKTNPIYQPENSLELKRATRAVTAKIKTEFESESRKVLRERQDSKSIMGNVLRAIHNHPVVADPDVSKVVTGVIGKLGRAKIILNRLTDPKDKVPIGKPLSTRPAENTITKKAKRDVSSPVSISRNKSTLTKVDQNFLSTELGTTPQLKTSKQNSETKPPDSSKLKPREGTDIKNKVFLINISTSPYTKLELQGLPIEVEYNPETSWSTVKSIGRNNPYYVYTGAEDTISFEVTWYANDPKSREDVINKCKLLESWSKADSYTKSPPLIQLLWGASGIFSEETYILTQAKYKLSNFQNAFRTKDKTAIVDAKLLPNTAVQSLVFKKVTGKNSSHEDIISSERIKSTKGITQ